MNRSSLFVVLLVGGLLAWFFAEALFGSGMFAFRDAGHFYYRLLDHVRGEWLAGRVPLWNPQENLGVPLAGTGTSGAFYPGSLVLLLPVPFAWAYKLYVVGHVALAAGAMYWLARRWRASVGASAVAAISYAFCGNVLFQYCNVVYLVGAAWLPLAVAAADVTLRRRSLRGSLALGCVLATMVLGGNAEMAYHVGLLASGYVVLLACRRGRRTIRRSSVGYRTGLLLLAAGVGFLLAAVQILPTAEYASRVNRASWDVPRNVFEIPAGLAAARRGDLPPGVAWHDGLTGRYLARGTHHEHAYHFSVGPWRLAEYVWPNISGRQLPIHRRWLAAFPAEGRVWVSSLYMGIIPLLLAISALRFRRGPVRRRWLSWMVVAAVVASFGWYAPGWIWRETCHAFGGESSVTSPVGGLYWFLTVTLPGYAHFRYPGKLLVIAAFGLSMCAAIGWDRAMAGRVGRLSKGLLVLAAISLIGVIGTAVLLPRIADRMATIPADPFFGPIHIPGAIMDITCGFAQTGVVCLLFWGFLARRCRGESRSGGNGSPANRLAGSFAGVVLVAVDLALANGWMVVCAPQALWTEASPVAEAIRRDAAGRGLAEPFRVFRQPIWLPPSWGRTSSPERLAEGLAWDCDSLFPKHHLPTGLATSETHGSMQPLDYTIFLGYRRRVLSTYAILQGRLKLSGGERVELPEHLEDISLWHNPRALPRAWIVHHITQRPPLGTTCRGTVAARTREAFALDWMREAMIESPLPLDLPSKPDASRPITETCEVTTHTARRVEIEATLAQPGLLILFDQYYPGWRATVTTDNAPARTIPILRANRVMRGLPLPAGRHQVVLHYRPRSVLIGAIISIAAWSALCCYWVAKRGRPG